MPIVDRCKFCLRCWDSTPNPNIAQAKADPTKKNLQKARKEGRECGPCRGHIKSQFPEWDDKKTALEKQIAQDEAFADAYNDSLKKWEHKTYVEGGRSRGAGGGAGAGVTLLNTAQYRTTELVGYLWPVPIYKQNINKALPKHLTTIKHCGRLVKGVVLGSEHGHIPGVIKVEKVGTCEVNGWKALDVDDNVRKGGHKAVFDTLQKNVAGVSASKRKKPENAPEDEPDTYTLANPWKEKKKKAENGSDDDDDGAGLDALFNSIRAVKNSKPNAKKRLSETDEGDEDGCNSEHDDDGAADSTTATPKKRGRKTETDAASRSKSSDGAEKIEKLKQSDARRKASELAKTGDSPNVCFKERVKHVTAVHTARQVVTHVHNLVENLQDAHMFPRVTLKAYKDLHAKVDKALSTDTIALYMIAGEDPLSDADPRSTKAPGIEVSIRKRLVPASARPYVIFVLLCFARFAFESL